MRWLTNKLKLDKKEKGNQFSKWSRACSKIPSGLSDDAKLPLGNLNAYRDWGNAVDYCRGMTDVLNHDTPDDFVLATGETHSVLEFIQEAFCVIGLPDDYDYIMQFVKVDPRFYRPCEVEYLCGDASKIKEKIGWEAKDSFRDLVKSMVENEINLKLGHKLDLGI